MIGLKTGDRTVYGIGGAIAIQARQPALRCASEELAARYAQSFRRLVNATECVVRKLDGRLHAAE